MEGIFVESSSAKKDADISTKPGGDSRKRTREDEEESGEDGVNGTGEKQANGGSSSQKRLRESGGEQEEDGKYFYDTSVCLYSKVIIRPSVTSRRRNGNRRGRSSTK